MARTTNCDAWRARGAALLDRPVTVEALVDEIARYDAADAAALTSRLRAEASLDRALDALEAHYRAVIDGARITPIDPDAAAAALSRFLTEWLPNYGRHGPFAEFWQRLAAKREPRRRRPWPFRWR